MDGRSPKVRLSHGLRRPWMKSRRDRRDTDTQLNISHQQPTVSKARTNFYRGGHQVTICSVETLMALPGHAKIQRRLHLRTIQCQLQQRFCQLLYTQFCNFNTKWAVKNIILFCISNLQFIQQ